ncbi:MAG: response regulator transcription factor [Clostridia bacterium]|nr:response regulator transcription factor [Clostridia bacterium]
MHHMIYIVEDDRNIQEIELFALKNSGYQAAGFETAQEFYRAVEEKLPELILLDIMLPDEDGLSILSRLRANPDTRRIPVILVTAKSTELDKVKGLDTGADDYLAKPFGIMELIARVKALLRRSGVQEENVITCSDVTLDSDKRMVTAMGRPVDLTYKEFELLRLLMKNHGIVISRDVIMERVWDSNFEGESRTIDVHVRTLRAKLGESGALIKTIRNVGYMADASI